MINSLITYAAVLISIYYILAMFGVDTRTILASAGILGIVIGIGAKDTIADILAGIFLIFEDVIHVGDYIVMGDKSGIVMDIGVRMTRIQEDGTIHMVNNSDMKGAKNLSGGDARIVGRLTIKNGKMSYDDLASLIETELPGITKSMKGTGYATSDLWYSGVEAFEFDKVNNDGGYYIQQHDNTMRGGYSGPTDGIKLAEGTKHFKYGGYHRIELGKQYRAILSKKQNYSVIVREKDSEGKSYYPFIDTFNEQGSREWSLAYYGKTVINPGESYLYDDGKWQDLSDGKLQASIIRQKEKIIPGDPQIGWTMDNFPIKAYGETVKIGENYFTGYLVSYRMQEISGPCSRIY